MSWQLFTIISVLSLSISVLLQRTLLHKYKTDPFAYAVVFQGIVGLLLLAAALVHGFTLAGIEQYLLPALISVLCFGVGHIFYAKTLQKVEASAFSVLFATQAIWTTLLGVFLLRESMTALQIAGGVLLFVSIGILAKNFYALFKDRGTLLGLLTGLLFGVAIYFWSYVGRGVDGISWAAISFIFTSLVVLFIKPSALQQFKSVASFPIISRMFLLSVFYGLGSFMMLLAYKYGTFAVVSPLRQTSIIVTVLLALLLLPAERNRVRRKILAAAVCLAGVLLLIL